MKNAEQRVVERCEDMSQHGKLKLLMQPDGDIVVALFDAGGIYGAVEFCASGGRSPATLAALRGLFVAMKADNDGRALEQREAGSKGREADVERVAKAMYEAECHPEYCPWDTASKRYREIWIDRAHAAIHTLAAAPSGEGE